MFYRQRSGPSCVSIVGQLWMFFWAPRWTSLVKQHIFLVPTSFPIHSQPRDLHKLLNSSPAAAIIIPWGRPYIWWVTSPSTRHVQKPFSFCQAEEQRRQGISLEDSSRIPDLKCPAAVINFLLTTFGPWLHSAFWSATCGFTAWIHYLSFGPNADVGLNSWG